nr:hypothetical protein [Tanacetum cinerariifolium]
MGLVSSLVAKKNTQVNLLTTRSTPTITTTTTTTVTNSQLKALIDQGVANALTARDADRNQNGKETHDSGMGARRQVPPAREKETVFRISNCTMENQIKFATCTLLGSALTWWNSHVTTVGPDVAYALTWTNLKKKMIDKYCPRGEIKKLEELALMCARMFPEESDKIERYVDGLPDMIHRSVMASKPKTMAYVAGHEEKKPYGGSKPLCSKCNYHHDGLCALKCHKCNRVSHLARDCRSYANTNNQRKLTYYECRNQGHYKSDCPELKNQKHQNQAKGTGAHRMVHALGGGETNQDLNNMEDDINA